MPASMTKADVFALFPANRNAETERARGQFLAALRLRDALLAVGLRQRLAAWQERRRTARALAALPDAMLRDIGVTRAEIDHAAMAATAPHRPAAPARFGRPRTA